MLAVAALSLGSGSDPGARFLLTESIRSDTTKTVIEQGSGSMTQESTAIRSQWRFEATIPFTAAEWTRLGRDGTVSVKIGKQLVEEKISPGDGFDPKNTLFTFKLTQPLVAYSGFRYLTLPTDQPAPPAPPKGTRTVYGHGSIQFKDSTLRIRLATDGGSALSLAAQNFVAVGEGSFEGTLPIELTAGTRHQESELKITGTARHRDTLKDEPMGTTVLGRDVQLSLSGKA